MMFVRILQGAAIPLLFVGPYTLAMHWAEQSKRLGVFMGVMLATDGIGTVVAGYAYSNVLSAWGWRAGSLGGAVALLAIAVLLWVILEEPTVQVSDKVEAGAKPRSQVREYITVVRQGNVIVAALFLIGVWGSYSVAIYWVPILLIEEAHWSENAAGFAGALYPLAGVVSAVFCGLISDRLGRRKPLMLISGLGMVLAFAGAAIAVGERRFDIVALTLPIGGLFAYSGLPLGYCIAAHAVGIKSAGTATGCIMGTGLLVGGVFYPLVLGYLRDTTGLYAVGFAVVAVSLFLCNFVAVLFSRDTPKHDRAAEQVMLERAAFSAPSQR
jgi:sugar phosphate permease